MTNILQALAVAATLITVTVAGTSSVLAGSDSPLSGSLPKSESSPSVRQRGKRDTRSISAGRLGAWGALG